MVIRYEEPADVALVRRVVEAAFPQPFEAELVDRLRADGDSVISLVAVDDGEVVGQALFSKMTAPFRALALAPVSVMPRRQSSGIGSQMIRAGLKHAASDRWEGVFVLGNPKYYRRFGFSPEGARGFVSAYAGPHLMVLGLGGDLPVAEGRIEHAPAFAALGL